MKKLVLTAAIILGLGMSSFAQDNGLFGRGTYSQDSYGFMNRETEVKGPGLPGHGENTDQPAPLGGGAVLLITLGAAYAIAKRRKE